MTVKTPQSVDNPPAGMSQGGFDTHQTNRSLSFSTLPPSSVPRTITTETDVMLESPSDDNPRNTSARGAKGKGNDVDLDAGLGNAHPSFNRQCPLLALPAELIASILSYLTPYDLDHLSKTCRSLYIHANEDRLWQAHVQANVPGQKVTSCYPCATFRDLFWAHEPRWFLTKHKIWFADASLMGKLIVARYDQRRGCIEGYYLLANNRDDSDPVLVGDVFHTPFDPEVKLHLDKPSLRLPAKPVEESYGTEEAIHTFNPHQQSGEASAADAGPSSSKPTSQPRNMPETRVFEPEIAMELSTMSGVQTSFRYAQCLSPGDMAERTTADFPYGNIWPPPTIPSSHRVLASGIERPLRSDDGPRSMHDVCHRAFRLSTGFRVGSLEGSIRALQEAMDRGINFADEARLILQAVRYNSDRSVRRLPMGEEVATYATLDPALYTPTPHKPFRGIWVGEYGPHGCEFLLMHQPDDDDDDNEPFDAENRITRLDGETDEAFARRKRDATVYRGRLEAIKLTGDSNIPRGEHSFVVDDLGEGGFVSQEEPFVGAWIVPSKGHVALNGYNNDEYVDGRLIVISPDRLAHTWFSLRHVSYFHRVDIDQFLVPD